MSSCAAPSYFPLHKDSVSGQYGLDGGCYANDPTDCCYAEAIKLYGSNAKIKILSVGTGYLHSTNDPSKLKKYGGINWLLCGNLIDLMFHAPALAVDYKMKAFTEALGHEYLQLNCDSCDIGLDDVSEESIEKLKTIGNDVYDKNRTNILAFFCG